MKAAHILFSLYFFALLIMPCADREDCNEFKQISVSQTTHQQQHAEELCTPFCVCSCCAAHFLIAGLPNNLNLTSTITTIYTNHSSSGLPGAIVPIWQPPKIG